MDKSEQHSDRRRLIISDEESDEDSHLAADPRIPILQHDCAADDDQAACGASSLTQVEEDELMAAALQAEEEEEEVGREEDEEQHLSREQQVLLRGERRRQRARFGRLDDDEEEARGEARALPIRPPARDQGRLAEGANAGGAADEDLRRRILIETWKYVLHRGKGPKREKGRGLTWAPPQESQCVPVFVSRPSDDSSPLHAHHGLGRKSSPPPKSPLAVLTPP